MKQNKEYTKLVCRPQSTETISDRKKKYTKTEGSNRDWIGDLSICSRMLYYWAIPPCIQQDGEVSVLNPWELNSRKWPINQFVATSENL